ncbi:hypothetical protein VNO77_13886 [Canavalia gladiata]|uniref:Uncharacterized protein n=1 Tax=Canavalia gladiata TaxID=3824 RepID=A0AAN9M1D0_CANGL
MFANYPAFRVELQLLQFPTHPGSNFHTVSCRFLQILHVMVILKVGAVGEVLRACLDAQIQQVIAAVDSRFHGRNAWHLFVYGAKE